MPHDHEYSLHGGPDRARIGQILGLIAAFASAAIAAVVLQLVRLAEMIGWQHSQLILWPLGAVTMYGILYWWFNNYLWKHSQLGGVLRVPDLNGEWIVDGQTINPDLTLGFKWQGTMTIVQCWDRIRVHMRTTQSGSDSISAALVYDAAEGFRLLYHYRNEPRIGEPGLHSHRGFADLAFSKNLLNAEGEYFNGQGRYTFGRLKLTRRA